MKKVSLLGAMLAILGGVAGVAPVAQAPSGSSALVATMRSEPRSFNPIVGRDLASTVIAHLTHGRLLRVNRATQQLEPWLAEKYGCAADGLACTLTLRRGVRFSDGEPFTSADVLFSFQAVYDEKTASPLADALTVNGKPLAASAPDASTVVVTFPSPFGPGLRLLDMLPILPKHKLGAALAAGSLRKEWGPTAAPAGFAGLGPFVVQEYKAGERVVFARNPHYWRKDAAGRALPRLDRLTLEILPDQNTEVLRLQSGQADLSQSEIRPDDYAALKRLAAAGKIRLVEAGLGYDADAFWFNLRPGATVPAFAARVEFRRAVSHAVNRRAFADAVFLGAAEPQQGPVSPSNATWYPPASVTGIERQAYDMGRARVLLAGIGLRDANNDGVLEDASGAPVRFSLVTQKGNTALEKGATFIRDELKKVGVLVDVVPLEVGALIARMEKGEYEAIYFRFLTSDSDPAMNLDFWLSTGGAHVWNMNQPQPATPWERDLDAVIIKMAAITDLRARQQLFYQAQGILAANLPVIYFAMPRVYIATSTRVTGAVPAVLRPPILWSADTLGVAK